MRELITKYYITGAMLLGRFRKDQHGVTAIEYSLIGVAMATLIAYVLGDANHGFLGAIKGAFDHMEEAIKSVTTAISTK